MNRLTKIGIGLLVVGTGPLALIMAASAIGIGDPNPNPIGPGILAFFTFWPGIICLVIGIVSSIRVKDRG